MERRKHEVHIDAIVQRLERLEHLGSRPPHQGWKKRGDLRAQ